MVRKAKLINLLLFAVCCSIITWHQPVKLLVKGSSVNSEVALPVGILLQGSCCGNAGPHSVPLGAVDFKASTSASNWAGFIIGLGTILFRNMVNTQNLTELYT